MLFFLPESRAYSTSNLAVYGTANLARLARILIRRGNLDAAKSILARVYGHATAKQIDLKVSFGLGWCIRSSIIDHGIDSCLPYGLL